MARGTLSGMIAGMLVSGLAVGTASVMTEVPGAGAPQAVAIEVPAGSEFDQSRDDTQAELPDAQETLDTSDVAKLTAPEPDDLSVIDTGATESAAQPETDATELAMAAPETGDSGAGVAVDTETPVLPSPQANAPEAPMSEEELSISTEPAQPTLLDLSGDESAFPEQEVMAIAEQEQPASVPEEDATEAGEETMTAPQEPESIEPADDAQGADAQDTAEEIAEDTTEATTEVVTQEASEPDIQDQVIAPALPEVDVAQATPDAPDSSQDEEEAIAETAETSSGVIEDIATNVTTNRLPSVGAEPEGAEEAETEAEEGQEVAALPGDETLPPIQRFAAPFENPNQKPMMSIVLIDDGSSPIGLDALKSFPYPLNFAVDTGWSGAADAMQKYRDAGFEVLAMMDLPKGASASDTEVAVEAYLGRVPQAVAVMEGIGRGLQSSRDASEQLADILRDTGHGAVLFPNGLNTAQKLIARQGVPSASVFRDFDAKGQNATVIRRFLDQAAFKAGQEDKGVIMVGRLRAETISALLLWGLQDRAGRVAIAPVSAVLQAE